MDNVEQLIYNELINLRNDFKEYRDQMERRVSALERFKNKILGIAVVVGIALRYVWDYCKERVF